MTYQCAVAGRVGQEGSKAGRVGRIGWEEAQVALVEAVRMLKRMPGEGRMPFATDGPWHLISRRDRAEGDLQAWQQERELEAVREERNRARAAGLSAEEVTWMETVLGWLEQVAERDRKLVVLAVQQLAGGAARVRWSKVKAELVASGVAETVGDRALGMRYVRALRALAARVDVRQAA